MGKLRLEAINKPPLSLVEYTKIHKVLLEAQEEAEDHNFFWDLDPGEVLNKQKQNFLYVAEKEKIPLSVRILRKQRSLALIIENIGKEKNRISANDSRKRILTALVTADKPLKKADIVKFAGISPSTWSLRIRELIDEGSVVREGNHGDAIYYMA